MDKSKHTVTIPVEDYYRLNYFKDKWVDQNRDLENELNNLGNKIVKNWLSEVSNSSFEYGFNDIPIDMKLNFISEISEEFLKRIINGIRDKGK